MNRKRNDFEKQTMYTFDEGSFQRATKKKTI